MQKQKCYEKNIIACRIRNTDMIYGKTHETGHLLSEKRMEMHLQPSVDKLQTRDGGSATA
jgi:hypothetical protein